LLPVFEGKDRARPTPIFWEHEGNRAVRLQQWKLVAQQGQAWKLYDVEADRTEQKDLASRHPARAKELSRLYKARAERWNVVPYRDLPPERPIVPANDGVTAEQPGRSGE